MNSKSGRSAIAFTVILAAVVAAPVSAAQGAGASPSAVANSLIAKEKSSWTLAIKKNAVAYRALHAQNFLTVSESGVAGRVQSEASALDANVTFDECELTQMHLHWMQPNVVLITYRVRFAGSDRGKKFAGDQYASSLWVKDQTRWLNTFYQATPASKQ